MNILMTRDSAVLQSVHMVHLELTQSTHALHVSASESTAHIRKGFSVVSEV